LAVGGEKGCECPAFRRQNAGSILFAEVHFRVFRAKAVARGNCGLTGFVGKLIVLENGKKSLIRQHAKVGRSNLPTFLFPSWVSVLKVI
jgi:hypothetical protein